MAAKCPGAETILRALIDNDEGVRGLQRRQSWLDGQTAEYLQELADSAYVLMVMCGRALGHNGGQAVAEAILREQAGGRL